MEIIRTGAQAHLKTEVKGWVRIYLEGTPKEIGFQHGHLLAEDIQNSIRRCKTYLKHTYGFDWDFCRRTAEKIYLQKIPQEYLDEIEGIVDGITDAGKRTIDTVDIVGLNGFFDTVSYHQSLKRGKAEAKETFTPPHCSAFVATGEYTRRGEVIMAHNTWFPYIFAHRGFNTLMDIKPTRGKRVLMQSMPGMIFSGSDWYVNSAGLMVCETTITGAAAFNPDGVPVFVRAREAIQYSDNIESWMKTMEKENNGGYASDWLIGDGKSSEIGWLELGAYTSKKSKTRSGYYGGSNLALDEETRKETTMSYREKGSSPAARHLRWRQLMTEMKGKISVESAKKLIQDHVDSSTGKSAPSRSTICGHVELDERGIPEWGCGAYYPQGAFDGKVTSSNLAVMGGFWARWGKPCGSTFKAEEFLSKHQDYVWQKEILGDLCRHPWHLFTVNET